MQGLLATGFILFVLIIFGRAIFAIVTRGLFIPRWRRFAIRSLAGAGLIFAWNVMASWTGLGHIGFNILTLAITGVLGVPGLLSLVTIRYGLS
ncbi:pro-sigmaK processing inhibitor BofA family protein [Sulfobacillus thermosulfidooxidans]|uniref:pro-sigmaK processing inhibitor BofA family protein n=1 Tax=Sulfobacillus thermosulfidooxidans TaxID=28034 RepID=UPI0006B551AB|nr:pro-sigmaK processing inhibitor BofA family protein [Sulfobacillus thermosulfidooxidans]